MRYAACTWRAVACTTTCGKSLAPIASHLSPILVRMNSREDIHADRCAQSADAPGKQPASPGRRAALYGMLVAAALVCGYLELLVPLPVTVPGVKLGLGNAVVLIALNRLGARAGFYIMLFKVLASALLFANLQMLAFSLAGGLISWAVMSMACRSGIFSTVSVSVLGGIAHNAGQLLAVAVLLSTQVALANAPVLALAGTLCGLATGIVAQLVLRALPPEVFHG